MRNCKLRVEKHGLWVFLVLALNVLSLISRGAGQGRRPTTRLRKETITAAYAGFLRERGIANPVLSDMRVEWKEGSYTIAGAREAIVSISDMASWSHADGYARLFLFRAPSGHDWRIAQLIGSPADELSFQTVDLEGDGRSEIWVESMRGGQGHFDTSGKLYTLAGGTEMAVYKNAGFDHVGAEIDGDGELLCTHRVEFEDIDRDMIKELVDVEERTTFRKGVAVSATSSKTIWKYRNGRFMSPDAPKSSQAQARIS